MERKGTIRAGMKSYFEETIPDFEEDVKISQAGMRVRRILVSITTCGFKFILEIMLFFGFIFREKDKNTPQPLNISRALLKHI